MSSQKRPRFIAALAGSALIIAGLMVPIGVAAEETPSGSVRPQAASGSTVGYWGPVQRVASSGASSIVASAITADDTVLVTGSFIGTAYFPTGPGDDSISFTSRGFQDTFVAALNDSGSYFAWVQRLGGAWPDIPQSMTLSGDGTVLVTGSFSQTAYFPSGPGDDSIALTSNSVEDIFVASLNVDDSYFAWAQRAGGAEVSFLASDTGRSVAVNHDDSVFLAGVFSGTATFPSGPGTDITLTSQGGYDAFVAAMNADDSYFAWAQGVGGAGEDQGRSVTTNQDDSVIVAGVFNGAATFPTGPSTSIVLTSEAGGDAGFIAALNADDSYFAWAQRAGGTGISRISSVATNQDDSVLLTGWFSRTVTFPTGLGDDSIALTSGSPTNYNFFVAEMNADDSYFAWAQSASGSGFQDGTSVAVNADDSVVLTGTYQSTASFPTGPGDDSIALTSSGSSDIFVAAMSADDSYFAWAQRAGGTGQDGGLSVLWTSTHTPLVTGIFNGSAAFPSSATTSIGLTALGASANGFFGWLSPGAGPSPSPTPTPTPTPVTYPPSAPLDAAATAGDSSATVAWTPPASNGSFPITNYQATSSPGGKTCLVASPATSCTIDGLTNGTAYTFTVRALNGAGWSPYSAASAAVTPSTPTTPTIVITGSRGTTDGRIGRVLVDGVTTDLAGAIVQSSVHLAGEVDYYDGSTRRVSDIETFTWQRKTKKKVYVYFTAQDAAVRSNRLIISP